MSSKKSSSALKVARFRQRQKDSAQETREWLTGNASELREFRRSLVQKHTSAFVSAKRALAVGDVATALGHVSEMSSLFERHDKEVGKKADAAFSTKLGLLKSSGVLESAVGQLKFGEDDVWHDARDAIADFDDASSIASSVDLQEMSDDQTEDDDQLLSSSVQKPSSSVQKPSSSVQKPSSSVQKSSSSVQKQSSSVQKPSSSAQKPSSSVQKPSKTDEEAKTADRLAIDELDLEFQKLLLDNGMNMAKVTSAPSETQHKKPRIPAPSEATERKLREDAVRQLKRMVGHPQPQHPAIQQWLHPGRRIWSCADIVVDTSDTSQRIVPSLFTQQYGAFVAFANVGVMKLVLAVLDVDCVVSILRQHVEKPGERPICSGDIVVATRVNDTLAELWRAMRPSVVTLANKRVTDAVAAMDKRVPQIDRDAPQPQPSQPPPPQPSTSARRFPPRPQSIEELVALQRAVNGEEQ